MLSAEDRRKNERDKKRVLYASDPHFRARAQARSRKYYQSNKGQIKARATAGRYRKKNPRQVLRSRLKAAYGLDIEHYDFLVSKAGGRCMACSRQRSLVVDHCHETGKVRGLICHGCNVGLGLLGDTVAGLERTIAYLKREVVS